MPKGQKAINVMVLANVSVESTFMVTNVISVWMDIRVFPRCSITRKVSKVSNKILVATGWPFESGITTEIPDLNNPQFSCHGFPPFPYKVAAGGGGFIANASPIICGGNVFIGNSYKITNDCFLIERKQWKRTISMRIPLESMASIIWLNQLLLTGGQQQIFFRYQKSIQTFAFSQLVSKRRSLYKLNYLPVQLSKHCSIKIDEDHEDTILVTV